MAAKMNVFLGKYINDLVKSGSLDIYFNDNKYQILLDNEYNRDTGNRDSISNINLSRYEPVTIKIVNNQLSSIFDIENMSFLGSEFNRDTGNRDEYEYAVTTKEPDLIVYTISNNVTEWNRNIASYFREGGSLNPACLSNVSIKFKARPTPPTEDYPFIKIYDVSMDNIEQLNDELREKNKELELEEKEPLTKYISSLYRIPYPLEEVGKEANIQIGSVGFESKGILVSPYSQRFNLGSIDLSDADIGGTGYKDVDIMLYVPNFKPIELDTDTVINKIIDIILIIDITTGKGTLNIEVNGVVQYIETDYIGKDIPFKSDDININIGNSIIETTFNSPYIIVNSLEPENSITTDRIQQRDFATWDYSLIKVDNVMLNTKATKSEQTEINRLLSKGVYLRR